MDIDGWTRVGRYGRTRDARSISQCLRLLPALGCGLALLGRALHLRVVRGTRVELASIEEDKRVVEENC